MTRREHQHISKVLVIDDEPMVCRTIARCLEEHEVLLCTDPLEAAELLKTKVFHLVLCDIMMPDLNGLDLYEQVVDTTPLLTERFIFISGGTLGDQLRMRVNALPRPLIKKPFDVSEFRDIVGDHLNGVHSPTSDG